MSTERRIDLVDLRERAKAAMDRMSQANPSRALISDCMTVIVRLLREMERFTAALRVCDCVNPFREADTACVVCGGRGVTVLPKPATVLETAHGEAHE